MKYKLSDLIDVNRLQELLDHLYDTTGIPSTIIDSQEEVIIETGSKPICTKFHRINHITNKRCIESDMAMTCRIKAGEQCVVTKCKNGLVDIGSPIIIDGNHIATVYQGQFFFEEPDLDFYGKLADETGMDKEEYLKAVRSTTVFPEEKIKSVVHFLTGLSKLITDIGYSKMKLNEAYIDLKESNEEITAVYEELTATEDTLREQYENLKEQSISLEESKQRYKLVAEGSNDIIWDIDWRTGNVFISDRCEEILGVKSKEIKTVKDYSKLIYKEDRKRTSEKFHKHLKHHDEYEDEYRMVAKDGRIKWILCKFKILRDSNNEPIKIAGSASDITDKKLYQKRIEKMAYYDSLTNLYNRNGCIIQINNKLNDIKNENCRNIAVFLLDLDNFKNINDIYGHSAGDYILQKFSDRIFESHKENELFARLGGDEFIVLIYDYPNIKYVEKRANDILSIFKEPFYLKSKEFFITASIGIAVNTTKNTNSDELFKNADSAMYRAKRKGKNSFCFFNKDLHEKDLKKLSIEEDLSKAIKNNEFFLVYQPKINIKSNKVEGFEALIRWKHPSKGIIPPMEFIPIAEQTGLIREIDFWVLEEVFSQLKLWEKNGIDMGVISLNISPNQLKDTKIIDRVKKLIKEIATDTNKIQIEITENMFIESFENAKDIVLKLKEMGFKISLDDFGKGYSSLNYLKWLPIDVLKIDKSFVDGIHNDEYELIDLIISLAHRLKLEIVAEGVEHYDQYEYLKNNKCDVIQGYYIAKPLSIEDAEEFIVNYTNVDSVS